MRRHRLPDKQQSRKRRLPALLGINMDNGAYGKYRRENPIIHESLSTFDNILLLPERLSTEEIVTFLIFGLLALYAVVMLVFKLLRGKRKNSSADKKSPDADENK